MRDFRDAKAMAQTLREALKTRSVSLTHSESLELVAKTFGLPDWNFLAAKIQASQPAFASSVAPARPDVPNSTVDPAGAGIPILPMRDLVIFPQMVAPIFVGREKTRLADRASHGGGRPRSRGHAAPRADDDPALDALYSVGVMASVIHQATLLDGTLKLFVSGHKRAAGCRSSVEEEFLAAEVAPLEETRGDTAEAVALFRAVLDAYQRLGDGRSLSAVPLGPQAVCGFRTCEEAGALGRRHRAIAADWNRQEAATSGNRRRGRAA